MRRPAGWVRSLGRGHRLELVLAAVSHTWLAVRLASFIEPVGGRVPAISAYAEGALLGIAAGLGLGLASCAIALHAMVARRRHTAWAAGLGAATALVCGIAMGYASLIVVLLTLAAIALYALAGRFIPPVGIVCLALVHTLTIAAANPAMTFAYPLLLAFTHVLAGQSLAHYLSPGKRRLRQADWIAISAGWVFWVLVILGLMSQRLAATVAPAPAPGITEAPGTPGSAAMPIPGAGALPGGGRWVWVGPLIAFVVFVVIAAWQAQQTPRQGHPARLPRLVTGWLMVYNAAWLTSARDWTGAGLIAGLITLGALGHVVLRRARGEARYELEGD